MLSENEDPLALGGKAQAAGSTKKPAKMGMHAEEGEEDDMFKDFDVGDLDDFRPEVEAATTPEDPKAAADPDAADEPTAALPRPPRPPLHPGKPLAVAAQPADLLAGAGLASEGGQDSCSIGSGDEQAEQIAGAEEQHDQEGSSAAHGDTASLCEEPAPSEGPAAEPDEPAGDPDGAASEKQAAAAPAGVVAEAVEVGTAAAVAAVAVAEPDKMDIDALDLPLLPQPMNVEVPAVPKPAAPAAQPKPAVPAPAPTAVAPPATASAKPPVALPSVFQPKQALAAKPAFAAKPAPVATKPMGPVLAAKPAAATAPVLKFTAAPPKFSFSAGPPNMGAGSSGGMAMPKAVQGGLLGGSLFKAPTSRLGQQPAGGLPATKLAGTGVLSRPAPAPAKPAAVGMQKAAPAPAAPPAQPPPPPPQQQQQQALRQPSPAAGHAGTPGWALPKHMQALPAAPKASTPAPFTPGNEAAVAAVEPPRAVQSPHVPGPAELPDDILAANFGPSAVLEGHEACIEESLALCVPFGDAVQEQALVVDQLNLEAEALRRHINNLRVDLAVYRSNLAFMDDPLQANVFEDSKRKAGGLLEGLTSYMPPSFEMPAPAEPLPPPPPLPLPDQLPGESEQASMEEDAAEETETDPGDSEAQATEDDASAEAASPPAEVSTESVIMPRALESAFNEQPLTIGRLELAAAEAAAAAAGAAVSAVPPTQETVLGAGQQEAMQADGEGALLAVQADAAGQQAGEGPEGSAEQAPTEEEPAAEQESMEQGLAEEEAATPIEAETSAEQPSVEGAGEQAAMEEDASAEDAAMEEEEEAAEQASVEVEAATEQAAEETPAAVVQGGSGAEGAQQPASPPAEAGDIVEGKALHAAAAKVSMVLSPGPEGGVELSLAF